MASAASASDGSIQMKSSNFKSKTKFRIHIGQQHLNVHNSKNSAQQRRLVAQRRRRPPRNKMENLICDPKNKGKKVLLICSACRIRTLFLFFVVRHHGGMSGWRFYFWILCSFTAFKLMSLPRWLFPLSVERDLSTLQIPNKWVDWALATKSPHWILCE